MKSKVMSLIGMAIITATMGTAHAAWNPSANATGHVTVSASSLWTLEEQNSGKWKDVGSVDENLIVKVTNGSTQPARFALEAAANFKRTNGKWNIVKKDDTSVKIPVKPADNSGLTYDAVHTDYTSDAELAAGDVKAISIVPDEAGATLTPGDYTIDLTLLVHTV